MSSCIAIIPARGGSKRIPRKNIKEFCGKPIICYSIEAALDTGIFDEVMVSTDDDEIAAISKEHGANVPFMRSEVTSNDFAGTDDVIIEVIEKYREMGKVFKTICCIYPTAPFITSEKLQKAYELMKKKNAMKIVPVVAFSYPPQRAVIKDERTGMLKYIFPENYLSRSQDLETWYHDVGQFYFYDVDQFIRSHGRIMDNVVPMIMQETEVQDIDNEEDWVIAEMKYQHMVNMRRN